MDKPGAKHIRVLLVDDHQIVRTGLRMIIESQPEMEMVGEAGNRAEALALAASENPDIILLDLDLGDSSGADIIADLLAAASSARIIILTGLRSPEAYKKAVMLGAMGIVAKDKAADVLINAIKVVRKGEAWLDPATTASILGEVSRAPKVKTDGPRSRKDCHAHQSRERSRNADRRRHQEQRNSRPALYQRNDRAPSPDFHLRQA